MYKWARAKAQAYTEEITPSTDAAAMGRGLYPELEKAIAHLGSKGAELRAKALYSKQIELREQDITTKLDTFATSLSFLNPGARDEAMKVFGITLSKQMYEWVHPADGTRMALSGTDVNAITRKAIIAKAIETRNADLLNLAEHITTNPDVKGTLSGTMKAEIVKARDLILSRNIRDENQEYTRQERVRLEKARALESELSLAMVDDPDGDYSGLLKQIGKIDGGLLLRYTSAQHTLKAQAASIIPNDAKIANLRSEILMSGGTPGEVSAFNTKILDAIDEKWMDRGSASSLFAVLDNVKRFGGIYKAAPMVNALADIKAVITAKSQLDILDPNKAKYARNAAVELRRRAVSWAKTFAAENQRQPGDQDIQDWLDKGTLDKVISKYQGMADSILQNKVKGEQQQQQQQSQYPPLDDIKPESTFDWNQRSVLPITDPKQYEFLFNEYLSKDDSWLRMAAARVGAADPDEFALAQGVHIGAITLMNATSESMFNKIFALMGSPKRPQGPDGPWVPDIPFEAWVHLQELRGKKPASESSNTPAYDPKAEWRRETANDYYD